MNTEQQTIENVEFYQYAIANGGTGEEFFNQILQDNAGLIHGYCSKYAKKGTFRYGELESDAQGAMFKAVQTYQTSKDASFASWYFWKLRGEQSTAHKQEAKHSDVASFSTGENDIDPIQHEKEHVSHYGLESAMKTLTPRESAVLKLLHGMGQESVTAKALAKNMGISSERVRQIKESGLTKLRNRLLTA